MSHLKKILNLFIWMFNAVKRWYGTARFYAKNADYWRERCLDGEKDLKDREQVICDVWCQLGAPWAGQPTREYNSSKILHNAETYIYTHPDCMKETA